MRPRHVLSMRMRNGQYIDECYVTDSDFIYWWHRKLSWAVYWMLYGLAALVSSPVPGDELRKEKRERLWTDETS